MKRLNGKTAWITGGKRIGQRVAELLAKNGCSIILSYNKSKKEAEKTQKSLKTLKIKTLAVQCDVSSRKSVAHAANKIKKSFKKIDILILMASIFEKKNFKSLNENDFRRNFEVHVLGTLFPIQLCLGMMPKGSHIITVSDEATIGKHYEGYLPYLVSKNAINYLTKALSGELKGVYINTIAPGPVLKPSGMGEKRWKQIKKELDCKMTDKEAVERFSKLTLKLSTIKSSGGIYSLVSKKFKF
jgi:NAD(P)-dependent dehydrogenase (short-subunit alcohol dehydrogenase family)